MDIIKLRRGSGKEVARRTGPNDARRVIWGIGEFFLFSLHFFYMLTIFMCSIGLIHVWRDWQDGTKRKTGPHHLGY